MTLLSKDKGGGGGLLGCCKWLLGRGYEDIGHYLLVT